MLATQRTDRALAGLHRQRRVAGDLACKLAGQRFNVSLRCDGMDRATAHRRVWPAGDRAVNKTLPGRGGRTRGSSARCRADRSPDQAWRRVLRRRHLAQQRAYRRSRQRMRPAPMQPPIDHADGRLRDRLDRQAGILDQIVIGPGIALALERAALKPAMSAPAENSRSPSPRMIATRISLAGGGHRRQIRRSPVPHRCRDRRYVAAGLAQSQCRDVVLNMNDDIAGVDARIESGCRLDATSSDRTRLPENKLSKRCVE